MSFPIVELPAPICSADLGDEIAVSSGNGQVNFCQFGQWIDQISRSLARHFESAGKAIDRKPIALMMPNGVELYASQFAVLKSGGFFLPIDSANPPERIRYLLKDSGAELILLHSETVDQFAGIGVDIDVNVVGSSLSQVSPSTPTGELFGWLAEKSTDQLAYMIYTSGSSGNPKGVPIHWGAFDNHNRWFVEEFEIGPGDRCIQFASIGFDLSLEEIFPVLRAGACVVPREPSSMGSVNGFLDWVESQEITVLNLPTAFWHTLVPALVHRRLPESVRLVIVGGEAVSPSAVDTWHAHVPAHVRLVNGYGPTEATITCSFAELAPGKPVNIGLPIPNCSFEVISPDGKLVADDEAGELFIQGAAVAKRYWDRPGQTKKAFVQLESQTDRGYRTGDRVIRTPGGSYQFVGRVDNQLKIRGYRIEPDEIAQTICAHSDVSEAVVTAIGNVGTQRLVAFVVVAENVLAADKMEVGDVCLDLGNPEVVDRIQEFVAQRLPHYMVPDQVVVCASFPLTTGGKVDLRQLKDRLTRGTWNDRGSEGVSTSHRDQATENRDTAEWESETESRVAEAWQQVLNRPATPDVKFHESGGDSLAAMRLVLLLEQQFPGIRMSVGDLLRCPTVVSLAANIDEALQNVGNQSLEERSSNQGVAGAIHREPVLTTLGQPMDRATKCVVCFHAGGGGGYYYRQLFGDLTEKCSILIVESPLLYQPLVPEEAIQETIESIAEQYFDALNRSLESEEIVLVGYSLGAILALEVARHIQNSGRRVSSVVNLDQPVPQAIQRNSLAGRIRVLLKRLRKPVEYWKSRKVVQRRNQHIQDIRECQSRGQAPPRELRDVELELLYETIEDRYDPSNYDGTMHLIRAEIFQGKTLVPADYGWERWVAELYTETIKGDHLAIFQMPYLKQLAKRFYAAVDRS